MTSVVARRLRAHRLVGTPFSSPVDAVRAFGAVQAQDYPAATWAVGRRTHGATADSIDGLFDRGAILRTHILRPTWHLVLPEDVGWISALAAPTLRRALRARWRRLGIDDRTIARAEAAFSDAVADGPRTRPELGAALASARIDPQGQRLPHLIGAAELDCVLISGPRRGRESTYAAFDARAVPGPDRDRGDALGELARRYFTSHGPAQIADFVWWSGMTMADARAAIASAGDALRRESIDGKEHWFDAGVGAHTGGTRVGRRPVAHLLPNFDEYTVAYRDRSALVDPARRFDASIFSFGSVLANVLLIDGVVRGSWRRVARNRAVRIELRLLDRLTRRESAEVELELDRMARFLGREVALEGQVRRPS